MDDILIEKVRRVELTPISPMFPRSYDDGGKGREGGRQGGGGDRRRADADNLPVEFYLYTHNKTEVEYDSSPKFVINRRRFRRLVRCI